MHIIEVIPVLLGKSSCELKVDDPVAKLLENRARSWMERDITKIFNTHTLRVIMAGRSRRALCIITLYAPEKGSNPRMWKVSAKLNNIQNALPKKTELVFGTPNTRVMRSVFCGMRKGVAERLQNPRLLRISFHTFRHWKATSLYHQTSDILLVKEFLGHAKIENTALYIQIEQAIFARAKTAIQQN